MEICSVVLNSITDSISDPILTTKCCYNKFHKKCFTECMKIKLECPLCRGNQTDHIILINMNPDPYQPGSKYIKVTLMVAFILFFIASGGMWTICTKK